MSNKAKTTTPKPEGKPALTPKLRFPEFRDAEGWKEKLLSDVVNSFKTGKLDANAMVENGQYRFYTCAKNYYQIDNYAFEGEALLVAGNGAHLGYIHHYIGKFNAYQRTYVLQKFEVNVVFLKCMLERYLPTRILLEKKDGNTPYIVLSTLTEMPLLVPQDADEQQKISECLSSVDELIATQARKLDALKTHKKGLMQQLFPREGETQPRLRFPEFQNAGEWVEGQLNELSSVGLSNGVFNDPKKVGTGYKLINVLDMYIETTIIEERLSLLELSVSEFEKNQVKHGDIFFTRSSLVKSGIAVSNIYLGSSSDVTFDGHLIRFRSDTNKVVPLFAHYLFKTEPIRAQLIARGKSATMTTIGQVDVGGVMLLYPTKEEQQRIADCLTSLDDLIAAQTQKLEALKTHKKGLMQQLFPYLAKE